MTDYDILSATLDGEFSPSEVKAAADWLEIPANEVLLAKPSVAILTLLEDIRDKRAKGVPLGPTLH